MNSATIPRRTEEPHELDYEALRLEGLRILQAASGSLWTDFNAHDPGVTILEHLCHGLTDLGYRIDFPIADLLTETDGSIDFRRQALFLPQDILPCAPVTPSDFSKRLVSDFPSIQEVQFQQILPGVHRILVAAEDFDTIASTIIPSLQADRPLGEAFESVRPLPSRACRLAGEIHLDGSRDPAQVCADIHFRCARKLSSDIRFQRYDQLLAQGRSLEALMTGPLTPQGFLQDGHSRDSRHTPTLSELQRVVESVPGVKRVRNLSLIDVQGETLPDRTTERRHLLLPDSETTGTGITFVPGHGIPERAFRQDVGRHYDKLEFGYRALRRSRDLHEQIPPPASGRFRNPSSYRSIQEEFPGAYGIGIHGVPDGAPPEARAWANQLKAYLYPFEQIMVDFLGNIEDLPTRFSTAPWDGTTYRSRPPAATAIPRAQEIFRDGDVAGAARAALSRHDHAPQRRNRILDTMLAHYGERFPEALLRDFNPYHPEGAEAWIAEAKTRLLRHLPELSARRATPPMWRLRAEILLGLSHSAANRRLSDRDSCRSIVEHTHYASSQETIVIPPERALFPLEGHDPEPAADLLDASRLPRLSDRMHRGGCDLRRYFTLQHGSGTVLAYHEGGSNPAFGLAPFRDFASAKRAATALRRHLVEANRRSEGFHLVEHILLHPRTNTSPFRGIPPEWFSLRLSIVFSGWSARFANPEFRQAAESILADTLPAHVLPTFLWLDRIPMRRFEILHDRWLRLAHRAETSHAMDTSSLDTQSARLARFLVEQSQIRPTRIGF